MSGRYARVVALGVMAAVGTEAIAGPVEDTQRAAQAAGRRAPGEPVPVRAYEPPLPSAAMLATAELKVLDDATGRPIGGVEAIVFNEVDGNYYTHRTDAGGRLRFEYAYVGVRPAGGFELRKDGYVPLLFGWGEDGGPDVPRTPVTLRLRRGIAMGGIVVDEEGQPIDGATVVMTVRTYGAGKRPPNPAGNEQYIEVPSRTGRDGRWQTSMVPPGAGDVGLQLIHPEFVHDEDAAFRDNGRSPNAAALLARSDRQVLRRGVRTDGRVLDERGHPIVGAWVVDSSRALATMPYGWRTATDADGRFHIQLLHGTTVNLTAQARGYQPVIREITGGKGRPTVEFRLPPGRRLCGRIVNPGGKPIAGAKVDIQRAFRHRGIFFRAWSDADGRFEWDSAPAEGVYFWIVAEGFVPRMTVLSARHDKQADVVLTPGFRVRVRAFDARDGKPIDRFGVEVGHVADEGRKVRWKWPALGYSERVAGEYRTFLSAREMPCRMRILADGYEAGETRVIRGDEGRPCEDVRLVRESQ